MATDVAQIITLFVFFFGVGLCFWRMPQADRSHVVLCGIAQAGRGYTSPRGERRTPEASSPRMFPNRMMIDQCLRDRISNAISEALRPLPVVFAGWEGGSVAFGALDGYSDIDLTWSDTSWSPRAGRRSSGLYATGGGRSSWTHLAFTRMNIELVP